jgi:hypothetical protein
MTVFRNFESLENALHESGDVMSVRMGQLRDAFGKGRLGIHVRAGISGELDNRFIGYLPRPLPNNQVDIVLLYKKNSPIAEIVEHPTKDRVQKDVEQVRERRLVGEETGVRPQRFSITGPLMDVIRSLDRAESSPGHHFVSLKWFRDVALAAEELEWNKSSSARDAQVRDAIQRGIVLTSKVPNPKKPEFPVTSIRLNRSAPEVRTALLTPSKGGAFRPIEIRGGTLSATVLKDRR